MLATAARPSRWCPWLRESAKMHTSCAIDRLLARTFKTSPAGCSQSISDGGVRHVENQTVLELHRSQGCTLLPCRWAAGIWHERLRRRGSRGTGDVLHGAWPHVVPA